MMWMIAEINYLLILRFMFIQLVMCAVIYLLLIYIFDQHCSAYYRVVHDTIGVIMFIEGCRVIYVINVSEYWRSWDLLGLIRVTERHLRLILVVRVTGARKIIITERLLRLIQ
jgi:hypothetical protein